MPDALDRHLQATAAIDWLDPSAELTARLSQLRPSSTQHDAHAAYIARFDQPRSAERAANMRQALAQVRHDAARSSELTFEMLQQWQKMALGSADAPFRTDDAHAKGGLETYHWSSTLPAQFATKLRADSIDAAHPLSQAVRAYLDVCFFHPFADGNGRAARLVFDYFVTRGGFAPRDATLLFSLPRVAGRSADYLAFLQLAVRQCEVEEHRGTRRRHGDAQREEIERVIGERDIAGVVRLIRAAQPLPEPFPLFLEMLMWASSSRSGAWQYYEFIRLEQWQQTAALLEQFELVDMATWYRWGIERRRSADENHLDDAFDELDRWLDPRWDELLDALFKLIEPHRILLYAHTHQRQSR